MIDAPKYKIETISSNNKKEFDNLVTDALATQVDVSILGFNTVYQVGAPAVEYTMVLKYQVFDGD